MDQAWHGGQLERAAQAYGIPPGSFLDFSVNTHPFAPEIPADLWLKWRQNLVRYPELDAAPVRTRLSDVFSIPRDSLLPTAGGIEALYLTARLFTGKRVATPAPAFSDYGRALIAAGASLEIIPVPPTRKKLPPHQIAEQTTHCDAVFFGNPNNPTGTFYSREEMQEVIQRAASRGQAWVVDEAFIDFLPNSENETLSSLVDRHPNLVVAGSLTKFWAVPGLRAGFLATGNREWMKAAAAMQPPWSLNAMADAWIRDCVTPEALRSLRQTVPAIASLRKELAAALHTNTSIQPLPSDTNFLLLDVSESKYTSGEWTDRLGHQGVLVRNCDSFEGVEKGRFLRIAVRASSDNAALLALFKRLSR